MIYKGESIRAQLISEDIIELTLDGIGSVNKFDQATFSEFINAIRAINKCTEAKGLMITSAKKAFLVGADINEFLSLFEQPKDELITWINSATDVFNALEDLEIPTIAVINGIALGGGCELALACDYRIADTNISIGLPEVKLGIMPGFGGTVRLPRIIGADNAIEWMSTGKAYNAKQAQSVGLLDSVVSPQHLHQGAVKILKQAIAGKLNWKSKRQPKLEPLTLNKIEATMCFISSKGLISAKAGKHYPAPMVMVNSVEEAASHGRSGAMAIENTGFAKLAKTDTAKAQIGIFLADQVIKSKAKKAVKHSTTSINSAAVIGAGIMGGGIAYQSAYKAIPIIMKDINEEALTLGLETASNLLEKQVERQRIPVSKVSQVLNKINTSLSYDSIKNVDIVIEAVVENPRIKASVLQEVETAVKDTAILTSNTSTISINQLAQNLKRSDRFCGMHFFNPVHRMPLVEVIRGTNTSDETIATVVAYAAKMGKSPIVVNDCPGFYVNRVLFPYFAGFSQLILEGADFEEIDKVMELEFGMPMGPALLLDVVGIDTAYHCTNVMSAGFPTRLKKIDHDPISLLFESGQLGQKSSAGFYLHTTDNKGRPSKVVSPESTKLLSEQCSNKKSYSGKEIIERLMIPMINEVIRCLEEGVIDTAAEADMGLIYGIGFPPFRGGPIRYLETIGLDTFIKLADKYTHLGEIYQVTESLRLMSKTKKSYFTSDVKKTK